MGHRILGTLVSALAVAATASPVFRDPVNGDSFPLSTFPMFTAERGGPQQFTYAVGLTTGNERRTLGPHHVANREVMQAVRTFETAVVQGRLADLCAFIASRVGRDPALRDVVRVEIVSGLVDPLALIERDERISEKTMEQCQVIR